MKLTKNELKKIIRLNLITEDDVKKNPDGNWVEDDTTGYRDANFVEKTPKKTENEFLMDVLWKVLAAEGLSKNWNAVHQLDGGTVGIADFAAEGLGGLYDRMGDETVKKHFQNFNPEVDSVKALKDKTDMGWIKNGKPVYCRAKRSKHAVRGTCFASMNWWVKGMKAFLSSDEGKKIQYDAWLDVTVKPADKILAGYTNTAVKGPTGSFLPPGDDWTSYRGRAIAYAIVNSYGPTGLPRFSKNGKRTPNEAMEAYNIKRGYVRKRMIIINRLYPDPNFKPTFEPASYNKKYLK